MKATSAFLLALLALPPCFHGWLAAQEPSALARHSASALVPRDSAGAFPRARVYLDEEGFSFEGKPLRFVGDTLTISGASRDSVKVPLEHIRRLEVTMGAENRASSTLLGALIGGAAGFGLGYAYGYLGYAEPRYSGMIGGVEGTAIAGLAGAVIGFAIAGPDWREVRLIQ